MNTSPTNDTSDNRLIELQNIPTTINDVDRVVIYNKIKHGIRALYLMVFILLLINICLALQMYLVYTGVKSAIGDLTNYIDVNMPNLENYLNDYTLEIKIKG